MKKDFYYDAVVKAKALAQEDIWNFMQMVVCTAIMYQAGWPVGYDQVGYMMVAKAGNFWYGDDDMVYHRNIGIEFFLPTTKDALNVDVPNGCFNIFDCNNIENLVADIFEDVGYWSNHWMYDRIPMFREFINSIAMQHSTAG